VIGKVPAAEKVVTHAAAPLCVETAVQPAMGVAPLLNPTVPLPAGETVAVRVVLCPVVGEPGAAVRLTLAATLPTTTTSGVAVAFK
jgi:hypothetical protein